MGEGTLVELKEGALAEIYRESGRFETLIDKLPDCLDKTDEPVIIFSKALSSPTATRLRNLAHSVLAQHFDPIYMVSALEKVGLDLQKMVTILSGIVNDEQIKTKDRLAAAQILRDMIKEALQAVKPEETVSVQPAQGKPGAPKGDATLIAIAIGQDEKRKDLIDG